MLKPLPKGYNSKPEAKLASRLKNYLEQRGWLVLNTHGNVFQKGFPDKYCIHPTYKQRWIELKISERYKFTPAQLETFPIFDYCGIGIWVLHETSDEEYAKLFQPPNWKNFLRKKDREIIRNKYPHLASFYE